MLDIWFKPLEEETGSDSSANLGKNIQKYMGNNFPNLKTVKASLIGIDDNKGDALRKVLYLYDWQFGNIGVADLGTTKKNTPNFLIPLFHELVQSRIVPITFGKNGDTAAAQFLAFQEAKTVVNVVSIDSQLRKDSLFFDKMHNPHHSMLFHFSAIGFQSHNVSSLYVNSLQERNYDLVRLGKSLDSLRNCEPIIRDADFVSFHLSAIRASDAPGVEHQSPAGYTVEEACQLCRYAGMSDKLTSFGIFGFEPDLDKNDLTAQTVAQMIWYFLDGMAQRKNDYPMSTDGMIEYVVEFREQKLPITFWKSSKSGRWWVQVVGKTARKLKRHHLVPCAFSDYQAACQGDLSDKILQAMQRFS